MKYQELGKGVVKRKRGQRAIGLFIDGTGLDRATRRISRKVDLSALVRGVTSGTPPIIARYYTLIPYEDDSRQRAFLDAVARAGLTVVVKRLPPKGVSRQVSVDIEMASDIIAFALGRANFSSENTYTAGTKAPAPGGGGSALPTGLPFTQQEAKKKVEKPTEAESSDSAEDAQSTLDKTQPENRIVTLVCPSRDLAYSVSMINTWNVDTVTADFGDFNNADILKAASKWIDLSDSETIWRK